MDRLWRILKTSAPMLACAALLPPGVAGASGAAADRAWSERAPAQAASVHSSTSAKARSKASARGRAGHRRRVVKRRKLSRRAANRRARAPRSATLRSERKSAELEREADESRAVTIARVLATPCQNTQLTPEPANLQLVRDAVLCLVNTVRAEHDETPLQPNAQLEQAAEEHGQEMISLNYFDHVSPSGLTPVGRISATGYIPGGEAGYVIGENLAWGTLSLATPQAIVNAWVASPGHLANILEERYRDTGVSVVPAVPASLAEGSAGATYTQEFGVIVR